METASYLRTDFLSVLRGKSKIKYHATVNKVSRRLGKTCNRIGLEHRAPERWQVNLHKAPRSYRKGRD